MSFWISRVQTDSLPVLSDGSTVILRSEKCFPLGQVLRRRVRRRGHRPSAYDDGQRQRTKFHDCLPRSADGFDVKERDIFYITTYAKDRGCEGFVAFWYCYYTFDDLATNRAAAF